MRFLDRYPIVVTAQKDACRAFWVHHLGFEVLFDSTWFTLLAADDQTATIAFMTPDHPSAPPGPDAFSGKGLCFELQVVDAAAAHAEAVGRGLPITLPLTREPFGQVRFGFFDPSGLWVDVVEQCEPAAGYWDRYMIAA
ncbi:VOC family protein [Phreatobacter sp.]|uniref:VOC family protein n=1 Tax=Phreatobacter sp. TaxID=1966341 RepID=UPI003F7043E8